MLKHACASGLGKDDWANSDWSFLPNLWPDHLKSAILSLNRHILLNLQFSPWELLLGSAVNTPRTPVSMSAIEPTKIDALVHMAYAEQQR